jgi:hypothetical protein
MPFHLRGGSSGRLLFGQLWRLHLNTFQGPTYKASQKPVQYAQNNESLLLGSREMSSNDVNHGDHSTHQPHVKPPNHPAVNPHMDVIHKTSYYLFDAPARPMAYTVLTLGHPTKDARLNIFLRYALGLLD